MNTANKTQVASIGEARATTDMAPLDDVAAPVSLTALEVAVVDGVAWVTTMVVRLPVELGSAD